MQNRSSWDGFLPPRAIVMGRTTRPEQAPVPPSTLPLMCEGDPAAKIVFVGETLEDAAGDLFTKMIEAMGLSRDRINLCTFGTSAALPTKTAPPERPNSFVDPVLANPISTALEQYLVPLQPKVIVCLGEAATNALCPTRSAAPSIRGQLQSYTGAGDLSAQLMPTFHPAELLRQPALKREAWADLQAVARALGLRLPAKMGK